MTLPYIQKMRLDRIQREDQTIDQTLHNLFPYASPFYRHRSFNYILPVSVSASGSASRSVSDF
ncbi:MAG: hypothetical protein HeimC2_13420 [Candidatus Heimdallarchaeota archaeon LC_2]|nr:MAG: hypothetical protein HeimC2_13420 [Candidatus Heimdallarchaeota archaeon LC_2]